MISKNEEDKPSKVKNEKKRRNILDEGKIFSCFRSVLLTSYQIVIKKFH